MSVVTSLNTPIALALPILLAPVLVSILLPMPIAALSGASTSLAAPIATLAWPSTTLVAPTAVLASPFASLFDPAVVLYSPAAELSSPTTVELGAGGGGGGGGVGEEGGQLLVPIATLTMPPQTSVLRLPSADCASAGAGVPVTTTSPAASAVAALVRSIWRTRAAKVARRLGSTRGSPDMGMRTNMGVLPSKMLWNRAA